MFVSLYYQEKGRGAVPEKKYYLFGKSGNVEKEVPPLSSLFRRSRSTLTL